jgi:hypothetical protein
MRSSEKSRKRTASIKRGAEHKYYITYAVCTCTCNNSCYSDLVAVMATGLEEIETMMSQMLGLQNGEMRQILELQNGELGQEMREMLELQSGEQNGGMRQIFDEKLNIGENQSVDLPKMERQVDNLYYVAPEAVLRNLRPTLVGKRTIAEGDVVLKGALELAHRLLSSLLNTSGLV